MVVGVCGDDGAMRSATASQAAPFTLSVRVGRESGGIVLTRNFLFRIF